MGAYTAGLFIVFGICAVICCVFAFIAANDRETQLASSIFLIIGAILLLVGKFGYESDTAIADRYDHVKEKRATLVEDCGESNNPNITSQCMLKWKDYKTDSLDIATKFNKIMNQ